MRDSSLYAQILGITEPWQVVEVDLDRSGGEVRVHVQHRKGVGLRCPSCDGKSPGYDAQNRSWRHLDTCQYKTLVVADVPRVNCPEHGVHQVKVPWAEPRGRFTALFEALVIDWLLETSLSAVARQMDLSWDEVSGIQERAVRRGLERREENLPIHIAIDETSFQKRHEYVTVIFDKVGRRVVHVANDRKQATLESYYERFSEEERAAVETISMDMWPAFINATEKHIPAAVMKICFDRFHVAQHLGRAVDKVRREEHRKLSKSGDQRLKGSKYTWLMATARMSEARRASFKRLKGSELKTARAWAIKNLASKLWNYTRRYWAHRAWTHWLGWASRSKLEPIVKVGRMVHRHLYGIINAIVHAQTNAIAESVNAKIQWLKFTARGFRNRSRFRNAIYFHLGGLDLYPAGVLTN